MQCFVCEKKKAKLQSSEHGKQTMICSQSCSDSFWVSERLIAQKSIASLLYTDGFRVIAAASCEKKSKGRESEGACGEDSFFISNESILFGVTDGVGGYGGTSGYFARSVTRKLHEMSDQIIEQRKNDKVTPSRDSNNNGLILKGLLDEAHVHSKRKEQLPEGGTTAVIAMVDPTTRMLTAANLGDSGLIVLRRGKILLKTRAQVHNSGAPYQMTNVSDSTDAARRAEIYTHGPLKSGDLILCASDGVWDNLTDEELAKIVAENPVRGVFKSGHKELSKLAERVVNESIDSGRKPDDVTVVVARVYDLNKEQQQTIM